MYRSALHRGGRHACRWRSSNKNLELMLQIVELSESDRALVAAFDLSESRRPANEAAGREGTSDASVEEGAREFGIGFER